MQQLPDFSALHELSLTSKAFHELRSQHDPAIAPFVLQNELGPTLFEEAYWVFQAVQADLFRADYSQKVNSFINEWVDYEPNSIQPQMVPLKTIVGMSTLHRKVEYLVKDFCAWAMEDSTPLGCSQSSHIPLSVNESLRIARAFYRFELFCVLYRNRYLQGEVDNTVRQQYKSTRAKAFWLFNNWNAWENEEIACVRDYIYARLAVVFARIEQAASVKPFKVILYEPWDEVPEKFPSGEVWVLDDLVPYWYDEHSKCGADLSPQGRLFTYVGSFLGRLTFAGTNFDRFREMFLCQGIDCLFPLFSSNDPQEQADMFLSKWDEFAYNDDGNAFGFFSGELKETPVRMRTETETREAFFHGDEEIFESDENAEGPNFAWAWAGEQKFQPYYASDDRAHLRRWGYVMWDHQRLIENSACKNPPDLPDAFARCEPIFAEAHDQTCWRRSGGSTLKEGDNVRSSVAEEDQGSVTEVDGENFSSEDETDVFEIVTQPTEVDNNETDGHIPKLTKTCSDSGCSPATASPLRSKALKLSQVVYNDGAEDDDASQDIAATVNICLDEAIHAALEREDPFTPALFEHNPRPELHPLGSEASSKESSKTEEHLHQGVAPVGEGVNAFIIGQSEDKPVMKAATEPQYVAKAPLARKIARAISPKAKMKRMQQNATQKGEGSTSNSTETKEPPIVMCTTPDSTVFQFPAPFPPASNRSSTSSGSGLSIKSEASSTTSNKLSTSSSRTADHVISPPRCSPEKDLTLQYRRARQSMSLDERDEETEKKADSETKLADDITRHHLYAKDPTDVAAWIEQPDSPLPRQLRTPSPTSSESGGTSTENSPTKQQRKKANRKARKAASEKASKQEQEMEAERVKKEQARKEYQKIKKERKKLDKGVGKGPVVKSAEQKGKGKKERKTGYLIG